MIGKIHIVNKNTSKTVKTIDYEELIHNEELRKKIKDNYLNKDCLELVCGCNKKIKLNIDSLYRVYHKKNEDIVKHNKHCIKHPEYKKNIKINGWKEYENYISINLKKDDKSTDSIGLSKFIELLNIYSWNTYLYRYSSLPINKFEFLNRIFGISNKIKITNLNNLTLNTIFFNVNEYKKINTGEIKFTYMYLKKIDINKEKNIVKITGEYSNNKTFSFVVNRYLFTKRYSHIKNDNNRGPLAFGAFVKKINNRFEIVDFEIIRINNLGLYCKNKYEEELFNMFCKNKILFIKPYRPIPLYGGHIPTAILTGNSNKNIYVEIFDSNSEESLKIRDEKIKNVEKFLKKTHNLIRWDVYNNNRLPSLIYIKKLLGQDK